MLIIWFIAVLFHDAPYSDHLLHTALCAGCFSFGQNCSTHFLP